MFFLHGVTDRENCMMAAVVERDGQQRLIWKTEKVALST